MDVKSYIDELLQLIKDPRNVSPYEFSKYYPEVGELGNPNDLSKKEIEKHYSNQLRFKLFEGYKGYVSLKSKIYLVLDLFRQLTKQEQETLINYYVLKSKGEDDVDLIFASRDKILSKEEYYKLLGMYMVFLSNIKRIIYEELKYYLDLKDGNKDKVVKDNPYPSIFSDLKYFKMWERLTENNKGYAHRSYMYRMMYKHELVLVSDVRFRKWLSDVRKDEPLEQTKPLPHYHTKAKEIIYYNTKELIELEENREK